MAHTAGPWIAEQHCEPDIYVIRATADDFGLAEVYGEANARAIAEVPRLLTLVRAMATWTVRDDGLVGSDEPLDGYLAEARALIEVTDATLTASGHEGA